MSNLSPSCEPSPSLDIDEPCLASLLTSSGRTSSLLCTVKDVLPALPKPNLLLRPKFLAFYIVRNFFKL